MNQLLWRIIGWFQNNFFGRVGIFGEVTFLWPPFLGRNEGVLSGSQVIDSGGNGCMFLCNLSTFPRIDDAEIV
jgi:hypothetical protein